MDAYLSRYLDSLRKFLARMAVWQCAELVAARNPGRSKVDWRTAPEVDVKLAAADAAKARDAIPPFSLPLDVAAWLGIVNELFERVLDRSGITINRDPPDLDRGPGLHKVFSGEWWGAETSQGVPRSVPVPDDDVDLATLRDLLANWPVAPVPAEAKAVEYRLREAARASLYSGCLTCGKRDCEDPTHARPTALGPPPIPLPILRNLRAYTTQVEYIKATCSDPRTAGLDIDTVPAGPAREQMESFQGLCQNMIGFWPLLDYLRLHARAMTLKDLNWLQGELAHKLNNTRDPDELTLTEVLDILTGAIRETIPAVQQPGESATGLSACENEHPPDALAGTPSGERDSVPLATADPVTQAIEKISQSRTGIALLRYLANQPECKASLDQIAVDLDQAPKATAARRRGTIRQRYLRTRDLLEKVGAPVRLNIVNHVVELVIAPNPPERTTPM
jgi:hypothetical protein